ncbi:hypothetical protein Ahy_A07g032198 isoform A [Arachis hypogaea]|uniref:ADP-ribosylation factor-like protein 8B n=1 Tax=Arachis hypogaea TaxID=3818 RepID=A0A445C6B9_ARAHY|nr:hypothetical protein Ahy_A07g032198 isoform A [Arachis hypogaea]
MGLWDSLLNWLRSLFFKQEMELSLVGLQNAGKTSLVNSIATGGYSEDMIPTVGFNMRKVTKGNVTIKLWDLGGQRRFRTMWERYCRGVSAIKNVIKETRPVVLATKKAKNLAQFYRDENVKLDEWTLWKNLTLDNLVSEQNIYRSSYNESRSNRRYVVDAADRDSVPISRSELHELLTKPSLGGIPLLVLGNKIDKSEALSKQALVDQLELESIKDREVCCYMISCKDSVNIDVVIDWLIKHSKTAK